MRVVVVKIEAAVLVTGPTAAALFGALDQIEPELRRNGVAVTDDVRAFVAETRVLAIEHTRRVREQALARPRRATASEVIGRDHLPIVATASSDRGGSLRESITTKQAARMLGVGVRNVCDLCARGALDAERVAGQWRIDLASVNERTRRT